MKSLWILPALCLSLLVSAPSPTAAAENDVTTRFSLIVGFPDAADPETSAALVIPGTVISLRPDAPTAGVGLEEQERRALELEGVGRQLSSAVRLGRFDVVWTEELGLDEGVRQELPGPAPGSDVEIGVTMVGATSDTVSYRVRFDQGEATIADTPIAVGRGERAIVGGLDGEAAPYLFLVVQPLAEDSLTPVYVEEGVTPPRGVHRPAPAYTEEARKAGLEGVVIVRATIDTAGRVVETEVLRSLEMGLSEAAVEAIRQWRFEPARVDGRPVAVYYNLTINFSLGDKEEEADSDS